MNNLDKNRVKFLVASLLIGLSLLIVIIGCTDDLEGISSFYFADEDNPAIIKVSFSYNNENATPVSVSQPLRLMLLKNPEDLDDGISYNHLSLTNKGQFFLDGITNTPVYIIAWHDLDNNGLPSKFEPFGAYKDEFNLTNLAPARVYGGATTNSYALGISTNLLFGTGTLKVNLSYTGKEIKTTDGFLKAALYAGTNFDNTDLINQIEFADAKPKTYHFKGIESTNVYLMAWVSKAKGINNHQSGEPVGIYSSGNSSTKATAIGFLENITMEKSISFSFGDSYTNFQ